MELVDFLYARLAETEAAARTIIAKVSARPGSFVSLSLDRPDLAMGDCPSYLGDYDPASVLRDVGAKRQIVELHDSDGPHECVDGPMWGDATQRDPHVGYEQDCMTLRQLALPYDQHEDYREEWRP